MAEPQEKFEPEYRQQDEMFVTWSKTVTDTTYDVKFLIETLAKRAAQNPDKTLRVLDIGGGVGTVAKAIADNIPNAEVDVIDLSPLARDNFVGAERTNFILDNFLTYDFAHKYDAVFMRTLLHHLVASTDAQTYQSQYNALIKAKELLSADGNFFVTENFYEPYIGKDLTGRLIFMITNIKLKAFAGIVRKLGANTAGEGVRFRSWASWTEMFAKAGLSLTDKQRSTTWSGIMPIWQKLPLLCKNRFQTITVLKSEQ